MILLVDTREQTPFWRPPAAARATLIAGDYTTCALLHVFHIERKSPQDLYGTITKGHPRFRREVLRAVEHGIHLCVYVESTYEYFWRMQFPGGADRKYKPEHLKNLIDAIIEKYGRLYGVEFVWCGTRERAIKKSYNRLKYEESIRNKPRGTRTKGGKAPAKRKQRRT